jgi:hypothetical protein
MRSKRMPTLLPFLLTVVIAGCGGAADSRAESADPGEQVGEAAAGQAAADPAAVGILCEEMAAALPEMEARSAGSDNPYAASTALRLHLEEVKESTPERYEQILSLQSSDPDGPTIRQCPDTRRRVLELGRQQQLYLLLLGSLT